MKLHAVNSITPFPGSKITGIHYLMYHGKGSRCGKMFPSEPKAFLNNGVRDSLEVIRSKDIFPDVCRPAGNLTVVEKVADALRPLPHVLLLPVRFERLVALHFDKGDFSFYRQQRNATEHFLSLPDVPDAHDNGIKYFELIVAENAVVAEQFSPRRELQFVIGPTEYDEPETGSVSSQMCDEYPIMRLQGAVLFNETAFEIIAPHIDWDYFITCSTEL